jgi:Lauroyl/myristoyl acyltransferase
MLKSVLEERRDKMFRFKVEMFFIKTFKWILMKTPESFRYKFAEGLALLAYFIIKKRREVTLDNIRKAFPEKEEKEVIRIAKESYKVMIKTFMMSLWVPDTCGDDTKVKYHNYELFEQAKAQNKGVILASLHMGSFETMQKNSFK